MSGFLLDTHAFYWFAIGSREFDAATLGLIGAAQLEKRLFFSPVTAWEVALASLKPPHRNPFDLGDKTPEAWLKSAARTTGARAIAIDRRIAFEAAVVAKDTRHKDPGDCFLIATARVKGLMLVTRDATIRSLARRSPPYLQVVPC